MKKEALSKTEPEKSSEMIGVPTPNDTLIEKTKIIMTIIISRKLRGTFPMLPNLFFNLIVSTTTTPITICIADSFINFFIF